MREKSKGRARPVSREMAQSVLDSMDAADFAGSSAEFLRMLGKTGAKRRVKQGMRQLADGDGFPVDVEIAERVEASGERVREGVLALLAGVNCRKAGAIAGVSHQGILNAAKRVLGCAVAAVVAREACERLRERAWRQRVLCNSRTVVV